MKKKINWPVAALAAAMAVSMTACGGAASSTVSSAASSQATSNVEASATPIDLPEVMVLPDDPTKEIGKDNSTRMLWQGLLEESIAVGDTTRTAKIYIPEDTNQGTRFVLMNVPGGVDTVEFMVRSGWMELAEQEDFCLYVLEPENGQWGTAEEELEYIKAGYAAERSGKYGMPFSSNYVIGYDEVGADLQKAVMNNPINTAAAVYVNASNVDDAYIETINGTEFEGYDVNYNEVPIPTWIVGDGDTAQGAKMVAYWQKANDCTDTANLFQDGVVYNQDPLSVNIFTPRQKMGQVAVTAAVPDYTDPAFAQSVYGDFFSKFSRYGGGPRGNMLVARVDYDDLGVEFGTMEVDGYKREYLVYVPTWARGTEQKLPVVYAFHGAQTTMQMFFENTLWYEVAEERGFIVVFPESDLNPIVASPISPITKADRPSWALTDTLTDENPNNVEFVKQLIAEIDGKYNTDPTRRYSTGHSNGCMFTNYLGTRMSESFTALGAISGPLLDASAFESATSTESIPWMMTIGEHDLWNWDISSTAAEPNEAVLNTVNYWMGRNKVTTDIDHPYTYVNGRYNNDVWFNSNNIPVVRYAMVAKKGHFNIADEMWTLWDEWFSLWSRDADGQRLYMNATGIN